jgi:hypothetical protein
MLRLWRERDRPGAADPSARARFDRRALTARLAALLDRVTTDRR